MTNFQLEQLKRLPRSADTWQGAVVELPVSIREGGRTLKPVGAIWRSVESGMVHMGKMVSPEEATPQMLWECLVDFALNSSAGACLPECVEVKHDDAEQLRLPLDALGVAVRVVPVLPAIDEVVRDMKGHFATGSPWAGLPILNGEGVTLDQVRSFASAAAAFFTAAPWRHLSGNDFLQVDSPPGAPGAAAPKGFECVIVMGEGGQTTGLAFYGSRDEYTKMDKAVDPARFLASNRYYTMWSVQFDDAEETPPEDVDLWAEHDLPLAAENAYPFPAGFTVADKSVKRPDADVLNYMEALLSALSVTTEQQMDSGRWTVRVETARGPVALTLALPDLLKPPSHQDRMQRGEMPDRRANERVHAQIGRFMATQKPANAEEANRLIEQHFLGKTADTIKVPPTNAAERAQELCYDAFESKGRRQLQLARQALAEDPDCADAYVILAERTPDAETALAYYQRGVDAGARSLGDDRFKHDAGHFWGMHDTRPFMRAKLGLVQCLLNIGDAGSLTEAVEHMSQMLTLNPGDNQGVRYLYPGSLMRLGRDADAARFMKQQNDEESAAWTYTRAILAFRLGGDCDASRAELKKAVGVNPYFPELLKMSPEQLPANPPHYATGSVEEAVVCLGELSPIINVTAGASDWIQMRSAGLLRPDKPRKFKERKRPKR